MEEKPEEKTEEKAVKIEVQDSTIELKETKVEVKTAEQKLHFKLEVHDSKMGTSSKIGGK